MKRIETITNKFIVKEFPLDDLLGGLTVGFSAVNYKS